MEINYISGMWYIHSLNKKPLFNNKIITYELDRSGFSYAQDGFTGSYGWIYVKGDPNVIYDDNTILKFTNIIKEIMNKH